MEGGELGHAQFLGQDMTAMHWGWAEEDTAVRKAEPGEGLTLVHIKSRLLSHICITQTPWKTTQVCALFVLPQEIC